MSTEAPEEEVLPALPEGKRIDGRLGCAAIFLLGLLSMVAAWYIMKRKSAMQLDATTELAQLARAAESADGTSALRALGCKHAAVVPMEALGNIAQRLENARAEKEKRDPDAIFLGTDRAAIVCAESSAAGAPPIACKDVAVAFSGAVKNAALPFVVVVEKGDTVACTEEFSGDAEKMKQIDALAIPPLFPDGEDDARRKATPASD
jgi:hypothetical protein